MLKILLLTNRDSDNLGDQVIEACDISLIELVMTNLGINKEEFLINSEAAGIIPKKYVATKDQSLIIDAERAIIDSDIVIFGGAPLFNYQYQIFYERTAVTLELCKKHNKPVCFSAIGIEGYDENNDKCQRLKKTLNFDCVKSITTRDDFDSLQKYKENPNIRIGRVADPAVFSKYVYEKYISKKPENTHKAKVGIFIIRANAFLDNKIKFNSDALANLWLRVFDELETRGYDYELLTSGHFGDEAFLERLITEYGVSSTKCVFNMNCSEDLFQKLSEYDAVISCRLHPSIISYSMEIPTVSLVWNMKVRGFYSAVGHEERAIEVENATSSQIVDALEKAISEGNSVDKEYLMTIYDNLYNNIADIIGIDDKDSNRKRYDYNEIVNFIPRYRGTSDEEKYLKLARKFKRTYGTYNSVKNDKENQKKEIKALKKENRILNKKIERLSNKLQINRTTKQAVKNIIKNIVAR